MAVHIFGIRHHGPGCARALRAGLADLQPDIVLVEGPPDAHDVLPLIMQETMKPPVALLIYMPDEPAHAVFYPFTNFSPEWQAIRFGLERQIPVRFFDLPLTARFAIDKLAAQKSATELDEEAPEAEPDHIDNAAEGMPDSTGGDKDEPDYDRNAYLLWGDATGYASHELWWEYQIEQRQDPVNLFQGIQEAMLAMRTPSDTGTTLHITPSDILREAHMRQSIRQAQKDGFQKIAVVCGAWHGPALDDLSQADEDAALLHKLPRVPVIATWIPWTNSRLAYRSGYGAGITSPGWYEHLWNGSDRLAIRWISLAANLLRKQGLDTSSANVIEAVRLCDALAAMRGLPIPGLIEMREAIQTVLCHGDSTPMQLIRDRLEIGERMGEVPADAPTVPLQRDFDQHVRQLRLKLSPEKSEKPLDLDLRAANDRAKSQLFHRLTLLDIPWGKQISSSLKTSTFHEYWSLKWEIEFTVRIIEMNIWGNTIVDAATSYARHIVDEASELPRITEMLDLAILAELPGAIEHAIDRLQAVAAQSADVQHLMNALPSLVKIARYGDVRETKAEAILPIIDALFERATIGLAGACLSLDDDAARKMVASIDNVQQSLDTLSRDDLFDNWGATLRRLLSNDKIHGLVRGRASRLLHNHHQMSDDELQVLAGLALSPAVPATQAAQWVEGVIAGSGLALLHQDGLWHALDRWLSDLPEETFIGLLPLIRRAFSDFQPAERQKMAAKIKNLTSESPSTQGVSLFDAVEALDHARAAKVIPVLEHILGVTHDDR
jgi:Family of unknown function (DUF5682)